MIKNTKVFNERPQLDPLAYLALTIFVGGLLAFVMSGEQVQLTFSAGNLALFGMGTGAVTGTVLCITLNKFYCSTLTGGAKFGVNLLLWQGIVLLMCAAAFYTNYLIANPQCQIQQMPILSKQEGNGANRHWYGLTVGEGGNKERIYVCHDRWESLNTSQHTYGVPVWTGLWGFGFTAVTSCG